MAKAQAVTPTSPTGFGSLQPALEWPNVVLESLMQAQRVQWQALLSWQQSVAAIHQELWDDWIAHWGGVPIDV